MTPAIEVEASLPEPRPLDRVDAGAAAAAASSARRALLASGNEFGIITTATTAATAAADGDGDVNDGGNNNNAATALKLAECIGRVSAALAELGATVEALKGALLFEGLKRDIFSFILGKKNASGGRDDGYSRKLKKTARASWKERKRDIGGSPLLSSFLISCVDKSTYYSKSVRKNSNQRRKRADLLEAI